MTDPQPDPIDEDDLDTTGHALDRAMGLDQLSRPGRAPAREQAQPDLPPLTKRFPSMRPDAAPGKPTPR